MNHPAAAALGSSPRGRGKLAVLLLPRSRQRLIPAWAGKTVKPRSRIAWLKAHPRVGGENNVCRFGRDYDRGSSPRGRGKPGDGYDAGVSRGLIPAWAGKTRSSPLKGTANEAHPRVGGENLAANGVEGYDQGSSPRGRGKREIQTGARRSIRLIPAWAGKTTFVDPCHMKTRAHPRVGGENVSSSRSSRSKSGSSPRGRGKHLGVGRGSRGVGLIPAWAGKTPQTRVATRRTQAHPRVGGENSIHFGSVSLAGGSSPRGRGKHFLTCAFIKRIGQILETLELAVSSGSYSLCDVYATDAPQDQARNTGLALPSSRAAS